MTGRVPRPVSHSGRVGGIAYTPAMVWEFVFLMFVLKIPIVYLCLVVYWAVKAEPRPPEPVRTAVSDDGLEPHSPWRPRGRRTGPRRGPERTPLRARRAALPR
jgi:hypothetical protein